MYEYKKIVFVENVDKNKMIYITSNKQLTHVSVRRPTEHTLMDSSLLPVQKMLGKICLYVSIFR